MSARELAEDLDLTARTAKYADTMRLLQNLQQNSDTLGHEVDELGTLTYSYVVLTPDQDAHDTDTIFNLA